MMSTYDAEQTREVDRFTWLSHRESMMSAEGRCNSVQACDYRRSSTALGDLQSKAIVCGDSRRRRWEHKRSRWQCMGWPTLPTRTGSAPGQQASSTACSDKTNA